jgi:3-phenylpropionate/cinnamic acid dioxygenase small subunit
VSAGSWESYHAITTLLYRYAEYMDAADFDAVADLFADAVLTNEGVDAPIKGGDAIARLYRSTNRVHDDGTLRTRHVTTNVIVDIDEDAGSAAVRSAFVVLQQTPTLPLQPIVTGRYRDRFERSGGTWRFAAPHRRRPRRRSTQHLSFDLAAFREAPHVCAHHLLVVFHSRSGATQAMADAVSRSDQTGHRRRRGACGVRPAGRRRRPVVQRDRARHAGELRVHGRSHQDFLERIYYVVLSGARTPYAVRQGRHRRRRRDPQHRAHHHRPEVAPGAAPVLVTGELGDADSTAPAGLTMAAGLEAGVF